MHQIEKGADMNFWTGFRNGLVLAGILWIILIFGVVQVVSALDHSLGKKAVVSTETQLESTVEWFEWNGNTLNVRISDNYLNDKNEVVRKEGGMRHTFRDIPDNPDTEENEATTGYTNIVPEVNALISRIIQELNK